MANPVSSPTRRATIKTGTYTGNGADNRNIDIGVNLAAKSNVWVSVLANNNLWGKATRIEYGQGDFTMFFHPNADLVNEIQAFNATGFQVGSAQEVNSNSTIYRYIVIWQEG